MKKRLVFVEFEDEANSFIDQHLERGGGMKSTSIVAMSLVSQLPFKNRKIPYLNTLDFFGSDAHEQCLARSEEWLQLLESGLNARNILHKELAFHLRFVLNHLLWTAEVLVRAIDRFRPEKISGPQGRAFFSSKPSLTAEDRFLGALLDQVSQKKPFQTESIRIQYPARPEKTPQNASVTDNKGSRSSFLSRIEQKNFRLLARGNKTALIASSAYGLGRAVLDRDNVPDDMRLFLLDFQPPNAKCKEIIKVPFRFLKSYFRSLAPNALISLRVHRFPIDGYLSDTSKREIERTVQSLTERLEGEWKPIFTFRGLDFAPILAGKLRSGILPFLLHLCEVEGRLRSILKTVRPSLVLSPFSVGPSAVLGALCGDLDIPAVLVPHGSLLPPKNRWEEIEWRRLSQAQMLSSYPYTVAQTPMAAKHAAFYKISDRTWNTGPILFSKLEKKNGRGLRKKLDIPEDIPVIVYAVAQRKRSSVRFHIFETEDECLSSMSDVVKAVNHMEKAHLIIKLHPGIEFSEYQMRHLLPKSNRLSVLQKEPFTDVLAASDLLVSFTSTVIEEAIQNRIPVVLFDKWKRFSFFDAFDCSRTDQGQWRAEVGYYVNDPALLSRVFLFALSHKAEAASDESLYRPYRFENAERKPLSIYIEEKLGREKRE